jgi:hypothetical protein
MESLEDRDEALEVLQALQVLLFDLGALRTGHLEGQDDSMRVKNLVFNPFFKPLSVNVLQSNSS